MCTVLFPVKCNSQVTKTWSNSLKISWCFWLAVNLWWSTSVRATIYSTNALWTFSSPKCWALFQAPSHKQSATLPRAWRAGWQTPSRGIPRTWSRQRWVHFMRWTTLLTLTLWHAVLYVGLIRRVASFPGPPCVSYCQQQRAWEQGDCMGGKF